MNNVVVPSIFSTRTAQLAYHEGARVLSPDGALIIGGNHVTPRQLWHGSLEPLPLIELARVGEAASNQTIVYVRDDAPRLHVNRARTVSRAPATAIGHGMQVAGKRNGPRPHAFSPLDILVPIALVSLALFAIGFAPALAMGDGSLAILRPCARGWRLCMDL